MSRRRVALLERLRVVHRLDERALPNGLLVYLPAEEEEHASVELVINAEGWIGQVSIGDFLSAEFDSTPAMQDEAEKVTVLALDASSCIVTSRGRTWFFAGDLTAAGLRSGIDLSQPDHAWTGRLGGTGRSGDFVQIRLR